MTIILLLLVMGMFLVYHVQAYSYSYADERNYFEKYHNPKLFRKRPPEIVDETTQTKVPNPKHTPDFRLPEKMDEAYGVYDEDIIEQYRPLRISPHYKQVQYFNRFSVNLLGCICTTAYKRFTPLAGCAVITSRHIITTATSTHLILRKYTKAKTLENVLGAWYDVDLDWFNSSMYATPARIHYHDQYTYPEDVNASNPFPVMFDIAVWALTYKVHWRAVLCQRAAGNKFDIVPGSPWAASWVMMVGYQFMKAYDRNPYVWFKYVVFTWRRNDVIAPCPKSEWGWYHCFLTGKWAPLGFDHGGAYHRTTDSEAFSGLVGLNVLTMKLRSQQSVSYFIDLTNHVVMEFLHKAYQGRLPAVYLDDRFEDTVGKSPDVKPDRYVPRLYPQGKGYYSWWWMGYSILYRPFN